MKILKTVEKDMHTAMQRIHSEFGDDAMIVSRQSVAGGVEISFAIDDDIFLAPAEHSKAQAEQLINQAPKTQQPQEPASSIKMKAYLDELVDVSESNIKQAFNKLKQVGLQDSEPRSEQTKTSLPNSEQNPFAKPDKRQIFDMVKRLAKRSPDFDDVLLAQTEHTELPASVTEQETRAFENTAQTLSGNSPVSSPQYSATQPTFTSNENQSFSLDTMPQRKSQASDSPETLAQLTQSLHSLLAQNQRLEQQLLLQHNEQHTLPKAKALQEKPAVLQKVFSQVMALGFNEKTAWQSIESAEAVSQFSAANSQSDFDACWRNAMQYCIDRLDQAKHGCNNDTQFGIKNVHSFVGPSGSGKTAALCKIATQFCVQSVDKPLILLSYKQCRIAGFEELLYLADLLGVMAVEAVDASNLRKLISKYQDSHLILIDTGFESAADFYASLANGLDVYDADQLQHSVVCHWVLETNRDEFYIQKHLQGFIDAAAMYPYSPLNLLLSRVDQCERLATILQCLIDKGLTAYAISEGCYLPDAYKRLSAKQLMGYCIKQYIRRTKKSSTSAMQKSSGIASSKQEDDSDKILLSRLASQQLNTENKPVSFYS